jgi:hypothetical protein
LRTKKAFPSARPSVKAAANVALGKSNAKSLFADKVKVD